MGTGHSDAHSLLRRREGAEPTKKGENLSFIGAPGSLTAEPDARTATPVLDVGYA